METLQELLIEEMKDIYSAEKQIIKAMPKIMKAVQSEELKAAFSEHLQVTKAQVMRLEAAFTAAGSKAKVKHCKGMEGLLEEGSDSLEEEPSGLLDLQLIGSAQRIEHYEISAYGTAVRMAEQCGLQECAELLSETLREEEAADESLTGVAEGIYAEVGGQGEGSLDDDEEDEDAEMELVGAGSSNRRAPAKKAAKR